MGVFALFGELALRALLLGAMGATATLTLGRRRAEVQHAIWRIVLAGMLMLPLLMNNVPPLAILPSSNVVSNLENAVSVRFPSAVGISSSSFSSGGRNVPFGSSKSLSRRTSSFEWPMLALITYLAVAAVLLSRIAAAVWRAKKVASAATRVSMGLMNGLDPWPEVRESAELAVPYTLGRRNPIIVVPNTWREWDNFKLRSVLVHEL